MDHELILRGGRVLDPSQGIDAVADVAFAGGRVSGLGPGLPAGPGTSVRDVAGLLVTPGLIDAHAHVYWGGTSLGVEADAYARAAGVTTVVDTGSAGPGNFAGLRAHVIDRVAVRVLAYLHVSFAGIYGFSRTVMVGEGADVRLLAPAEAAEVALANADVVVGIKVRVGRGASGDQGVAPLSAALQAAERCGMPVMAHIDHPPPAYEEVLAMLRPGDVLTHAFRPFPNAPTTREGKVKDAVRAARARGVLFDVGHGGGSFAFATARAMLAEGFPPDTISSDVHATCVDGPAYDLPTTLSKFLCLGMPLADVIAAATVNAGALLGRPEHGTLRVGALGDATVLSLREGRFDYDDTVGERLVGERRLVAEGVVLRGAWWHPAPGRKDEAS